jgi:riboflavin synthase
VQGHVDGLGRWLKPERTGDFWTVEVQVPTPLQKYIVEKGSIGIDGISLTVASTLADRFTVAVIPKTWEHTNLSIRKPGDLVNLEVDIIAKYVEKLLKSGDPRPELTEQFLGEHGFL